MFLMYCWPSGKYVNLLYMYSILGRDSFALITASIQTNKQIQIKLRWALFVTYTILQSIMRSEMCSLHLTHPSGAVGSRHCSAWGAVGGSVPCSRVSPQSCTSCQSRDSNPQPWVSSPTLYPLGHDCPSSVWHGGDQFVALLRWYGSPGFFDSGLQLICIFWSLVLIFLLTIPHRLSMGFRSGEFAGQSSTPAPWSFNQLLVLLAVWAGAKSCWKMKSASLKIWSAEGSMKCSNISW